MSWTQRCKIRRIAGCLSILIAVSVSSGYTTNEIGISTLWGACAGIAAFVAALFGAYYLLYAKVAGGAFTRRIVAARTRSDSN